MGFFHFLKYVFSQKIIRPFCASVSPSVKGWGLNELVLSFRTDHIQHHALLLKRDFQRSNYILLASTTRWKLTQKKGKTSWIHSDSTCQPRNSGLGSRGTDTGPEPWSALSPARNSVLWLHYARWLEATALGSTDTGRLHHHRTCYWAALDSNPGRQGQRYCPIPPGRPPQRSEGASSAEGHSAPRPQPGLEPRILSEPKQSCRCGFLPSQKRD